MLVVALGDVRREQRLVGGAGELVAAATGIGPALRRAFAANAPYLVNVVTDPEIAYPRSTTGV